MNEKIRKILKKYDEELDKLDVPVVQCEDEAYPAKKDPWPDPMSYARWMINHMLENSEIFVESVAKTNRWLGFIQAVLWVRGFRGIWQLRDESRNLYD